MRLHLGIAVAVENVAEGAGDDGALLERFLHAFVDHQVNITLTVAQLGIIELVVGHAVLVFHDGQGLQRLREQRDFLRMDGNLAHLRTEHEATDANEVTDIEQFLEHHVVHILVLIRADVIAGNINLDAALRVLKFYKRSFTHDAAAHHAAGNAYLSGLFVILKLVLDVRAESVGGVFSSGIWIDAHIAQLLETLASANLLF